MARARRPALIVTAAACLLVGAGLATTEGYLRVKAAVAGVLIDRALDRHLDDGSAHPPWPWADMHPIARLECERLDVREPVLTGASGESMAFGIGHLADTAAPNTHGNCVLAGHRDTKMAWLGRLRIGDLIALRATHQRLTYRIARTRVVDRRDMGALEPTGEFRVTLVTCYPLEAILPGDQRYLVEAVPVSRSSGPAQEAEALTGESISIEYD